MGERAPESSRQALTAAPRESPPTHRVSDRLGIFGSLWELLCHAGSQDNGALSLPVQETGPQTWPQGRDKGPSEVGAVCGSGGLGDECGGGVWIRTAQG